MTAGKREGTGFGQAAEPVKLDFATLMAEYAATPGLVADKLKAVLELVAAATSDESTRGIVFAYDEAQNLADSPADPA